MHTQTLGIRLLENNLEFRPRRWAGKLIGAGCYPYAANFYYENFIKIGEIIGKPCNMLTPDETLVHVLKEELLCIGYRSVQEVWINCELQPGEQKNYLRRIEKLGVYHMFRQNADGLWSHKYKNELPSEKDAKQKPLITPAEDWDENALKFYGWCFLLRRD